MKRLFIVMASAALLAGCSTDRGGMGGATSLDAGTTGSGAPGAPPSYGVETGNDTAPEPTGNQVEEVW